MLFINNSISKVSLHELFSRNDINTSTERKRNEAHVLHVGSNLFISTLIHKEEVPENLIKLHHNLGRIS